MAFSTGRFGRIIALAGFVTAVFLLTAARTFDGQAFQIAVVATGAIALVTAIIGALIAAAEAAGGEGGGRD